MNTLHKWMLFLCFTGTCSAAEPAMRDAATDQDVALLYRKAMAADPVIKMKPAKGPDPTLVNQPQDLVSQSDFISFNGLSTLVPKNAIIQIPAGYANRIKFEPGTKLVNWDVFYASNRGWITTLEVNRLQAEGKVPVPPETRKVLAKSGNLIVATLMNGPISVQQPKEAPQGADASQNATASKSPTAAR